MADNDLEQRLCEESANIKVDSYQRVASRGGWAGGGRTLWAIGIVGAVTGAILGLGAPLIPVLFGASTLAAAMSAIPVSMAAFASTGIGFGFAGGLMLGRVSGTASAVAEENEKRMKQWTARQLLASNPEAHIVPDASKAPEPEKSFLQRVKDNYLTYVNPKVGMAVAAIGLIGGLIMSAAFLGTGGAVGGVMSAIETLSGISGIAGNATALTAYTAGVTTMFGALFGLNFPKITSEVTHFTGELLSGRLTGREWGPKPEKTPYVETEQKTPAALREECAPERKYSSYAEMLAARAAEQNELQPRR